MFANIPEHDGVWTPRVDIEPYHKALTKQVKQGDGVINWGMGQEFSLLSFYLIERVPLPPTPEKLNNKIESYSDTHCLNKFVSVNVSSVSQSMEWCLI